MRWRLRPSCAGTGRWCLAFVGAVAKLRRCRRCLSGDLRHSLSPGGIADASGTARGMAVSSGLSDSPAIASGWTASGIESFDAARYPGRIASGGNCLARTAADLRRRSEPPARQVAAARRDVLSGGADQAHGAIARLAGRDFLVPPATGTRTVAKQAVSARGKPCMRGAGHRLVRRHGLGCDAFRTGVFNGSNDNLARGRVGIVRTCSRPLPRSSSGHGHIQNKDDRSGCSRCRRTRWRHRLGHPKWPRRRDGRRSR